MLQHVKLTENLIALARAYGEATGATLIVTGRTVARDPTFFQRINAGENSFSAVTYDRVIAAFMREWPRAARWPRSVPKLTPKEVAHIRRIEREKEANRKRRVSAASPAEPQPVAQ